MKIKMKVSAIACPGRLFPVMLPSHWCSKKLCLPSWYESPVEKDFPRSGVTPPPSLTRRGVPIGAPDTCPQSYPPYGRPFWGLTPGGPGFWLLRRPPAGTLVRTSGFPTRSSPGVSSKRGPLQCFPRL
jgi:hypothetical protein